MLFANSSCKNSCSSYPRVKLLEVRVFGIIQYSNHLLFLFLGLLLFCVILTSYEDRIWILHFIFSEINRVLKPKGLNFFSVRNENDKSFGRGIEIEKGIYDINGFQIRFFTEKEIQGLATAEGFEILWIKEGYEEPVTLFLVSSKKA